MSANVRRETKAVVRFAEAGIIRTAQKLIDRRAMTIGGPQIAEGIEHKPERIDLAPTVLLDVRTIEGEAIAIARVHGDRAAVARGECGVVVKSMIGIEPSVEA